MIGDRYLTDVVYGNRNGLFTIHSNAFDLRGEPASVLWVSLPKPHVLFGNLMYRTPSTFGVCQRKVGSGLPWLLAQSAQHHNHPPERALSWQHLTSIAAADMNAAMQACVS